MHLKDDVVALSFRNVQICQRGLQMSGPSSDAIASAICIYYQITIGIIAASTPYCRDKTLGIAVNGIICRGSYRLIILTRCIH